MDDGYRVAVVGATGLVGQTQLGVLEKRGFPVAELVALASGRSAGQYVRFRGEEVAVREALPEAFEGVDLVFFAATGDLSATLAPEAVARGAVVIDKSNTWRMDPRDVAGTDDVLVGRVRRDLGSDRLWLWSVVDNLRKGAATNAVQIAETLIARDALKRG